LKGRRALKFVLKPCSLGFLLELAQRLDSFFVAKHKKLVNKAALGYAVAHVDNAAQPWLGQLISKRR
jgi:hypothetical protein